MQVVRADSFFALLQDAKGNASVHTYNYNGGLVNSGDLQFSFRFPLVQVTTDPHNKRVILVGYPDGVEGATLWVMDSSLAVTKSFVNTKFMYFDLQYSCSQQALYGIVVNGTYGRVLSRISVDSGESASYVPIKALPFMFYVNASSYDQNSNTYFGLLNNFNVSIEQQKLAVGSYEGVPTAAFVDLFFPASSAFRLHFVAWSSPLRQLFGLAQLDASSIGLVTIDPESGAVTTIATASGYETGPIFAAVNAEDLSVYAFVRGVSGSASASAPKARVLLRFDLVAGGVQVVRTFPDSNVVAAIARLDW